MAGPSENFQATDHHIVDALNQEANRLFENQATLNHVLAQVYRNTAATEQQKQTKAKISSHADKTKDMPVNGIMAFCTFYDQLEKLDPIPGDSFDYGYKKTSGLTKLQFRLKKSINENTNKSLPAEFTITLYPGSVFFMPLSTNRYYTHEIKPSTLDADKLPTRLGYVVRCSSTEAIHSNEQTFLKNKGELVKLEQATEQGMVNLRQLYADENKTHEFIDYGNDFLFSMNQGDYTAPRYQHKDEFRVYSIHSIGDCFTKLFNSIKFEDVGKGRQGATIVEKGISRGIPIVRTTTRYQNPSQYFKAIHQELAQEVKQKASLPFEFNNALVESYTDRYAKMGFHSDQAQDLKDNSYIALYSCYQYPELNCSRKLVVQSKEFADVEFEIPLAHNSVVVFSLDTNRRFKHKIVLNESAKQTENQWLGITYRTSKAFVKYTEQGTIFEDGESLLAASEEEASKFFPLRRQENKEIDFKYPKLTFTVSESDLIAPTD